MSIIKNIALHHTGGLASNPLASTQHLTWESIDEEHRKRYGMKSLLNGYGGYNIFLDKRGVIHQFRAIGEETAANIGHNLDTISICLAGNFTKGVDTPTPEQIGVLQKLLQNFLDGHPTAYGLIVLDGTTVNVPFRNILPHRRLQESKQTECNGNLPDTWGQELVRPFLLEKLSLLERLLTYYQKLLSMLQTPVVGGVSVPCWQEDQRN